MNARLGLGPDFQTGNDVGELYSLILARRHERLFKELVLAKSKLFPVFCQDFLSKFDGDLQKGRYRAIVTPPQDKPQIEVEFKYLAKVEDRDGKDYNLVTEMSMLVHRSYFTHTETNEEYYVLSVGNDGSIDMSQELEPVSDDQRKAMAQIFDDFAEGISNAKAGFITYVPGRKQEVLPK